MADLALVVQKAGNFIQWIIHYPVKKCIGWSTFCLGIAIYPLDKVIRSLSNWGQNETLFQESCLTVTQPDSPPRGRKRAQHTVSRQICAKVSCCLVKY